MSALILNPKVKQQLDSCFSEVFQTMPERYFSASGRTEISGNLTDHQHGGVLAGAVNLDRSVFIFSLLDVLVFNCAGFSSSGEACSGESSFGESRTGETKTGLSKTGFSRLGGSSSGTGMMGFSRMVYSTSASRPKSSLNRLRWILRV